jgi:hypothetical protein
VCMWDLCLIAEGSISLPDPGCALPCSHDAANSAQSMVIAHVSRSSCVSGAAFGLELQLRGAAALPLRRQDQECGTTAAYLCAAGSANAQLRRLDGHRRRRPLGRACRWSGSTWTVDARLEHGAHEWTQGIRRLGSSLLHTASVLACAQNWWHAGYLNNVALHATLRACCTA